MRLVRQTKVNLKKLKKGLTNEVELKEILESLELSLKNIFNVESETTVKWNDLGYSKPIIEHFKKELENKIRQEYDLFPKRNIEYDNKLCFILMPFDPKFKTVYFKGIKPAVKKAKLISKRADEIFAPKPIVQDIWEYINRATLIIADVTERNPNVFYEVGLSHAIPKRLIILTQKKEDVPFDIQHIRWILYKNDGKGRKVLSGKLYNAIKSVMA